MATRGGAPGWIFEWNPNHACDLGTAFGSSPLQTAQKYCSTAKRSEQYHTNQSKHKSDLFDAEDKVFHFVFLSFNMLVLYTSLFDLSRGIPKFSGNKSVNVTHREVQRFIATMLERV